MLGAVVLRIFGLKLTVRDCNNFSFLDNVEELVNLIVESGNL